MHCTNTALNCSHLLVSSKEINQSHITAPLIYLLTYLLTYLQDFDTANLLPSQSSRYNPYIDFLLYRAQQQPFNGLLSETTRVM